MPLIYQFIYGSTPWSCGYSILVKSRELNEKVIERLVHYCENYDQQRRSIKPTYNFAIFRLSKTLIGLMEIFPGWKDQVGRSSKIMRILLFNQKAWEFVAGNPFVMTRQLADFTPIIPRIRHKVATLPTIKPQQISQKIWQKSWYDETKEFLHLWRELSFQERGYLKYLQKQKDPFAPAIFPVEQNQFLLCRAIIYAISKEKKYQMQQCDSFSLNNRKVNGLCFRYFPYCDVQQDIPTSDKWKTFSTSWAIAVIAGALPQPISYQVLGKLHDRILYKYIFLFLTYMIMVALSFIFKLL